MAAASTTCFPMGRYSLVWRRRRSGLQCSDCDELEKDLFVASCSIWESVRERSWVGVVRRSPDRSSSYPMTRKFCIGWDEYEGFDPSDPRASLFIRKRRYVQLEDGRRIFCWVYAYNRPVKLARAVSGGNYGKARRTRAARH